MEKEITIPQLRKSPHAVDSISRASPAERLIHRTEVCARIALLLEAGPMSAADISAQVGVLRTTAQAYLRYMASQLRTVRKTQQVSKYGRCDWELGEDQTLPTPDELIDQAFAPRRKTLPAQQLGMKRDFLVAALFGAPAHN